MTHLNKSRLKSQTFQLTAVIASCGASFEVDVNPTITGIELKQKIAEDTSISMDDQVLFTQNGIKLKKLNLELSNSIYNSDIFILNNSEYTISMAPHIYIFDKHHSEHPSISNEYILNARNYEIKENKLNASPPIHLTCDEKLKTHPLFAKSSSIIYQTLPKYEIEFEYHYNLCIYVKDECSKKMNAGKKYVKQIQLQYKSLKVLLKHFTHLYDKLSKQQSKFVNKCEQQITVHEEYLNDFETDLTNLQSVELHSSLQTKSRKTMLDVVDEGSFRDWHKKAQQSQEKQKKLKIDRVKQLQDISNKLSIIKQSIDDIRRKKLNFGSIKKEIQKNENFYGILEEIIMQFNNNLKKVKNTINIIMESENDNELDNILFGPTEMEKCREKQINIDLVKMNEINTSFYDTLLHIQSVQEAMLNEFTLNVTDISNLHGLISYESKTMDAYKIALDRKDQLFFEFVKLKALPSAYKHCIDEIVRRRAFGILVNDELNSHICNIFDIFRNKEIEKRKQFINEYGMLPVDLVNGLTKMPGNIKIYYDKKNEDLLPIIDRNIDKIRFELYKEFEVNINEYNNNNNNSKWKWTQSQLINGYNNNNNNEKKQINNIDLYKEQNKWKTEKFHLTQEYENKILSLQTELKEMESHKSNLEIELDQYKRSHIPDPPNIDDYEEDSTGWDGNISEITTRLSTILGTSLANVNPLQLQQSMLYLSKMKSNDNLIAAHQVLQDDLNKLKTEIITKDNIIKKLNIENNKLNKQNKELMSSLDKLQESSINLRNEIESMLSEHKKELFEIDISHKQKINNNRENDKQEIIKLEQDIITYKNDIDKLGEGRTELLKQVKMLSDVNEEWEEKCTTLSTEFAVYKSEKEQKDSDDWMTMSYLTNENDQRKQDILTIKGNSVWLNGNDKYIKSDTIAGNNFLFVRDKSIDSYKAVLNYDNNTNNTIPVILDEDMIKNKLKQLKYPQLLTGEVVYIIQRTMPQNIGQFKKGDPVFIATAGSLKEVNFTFN